MNIQRSGLPSMNQIADQYLTTGTRDLQKTDEQSDFGKILEQKQSDIRFSKHASGRLNDRNIELSSTQLERLQLGTQKAEAKGINESLVLMDNLAFIVNVKNNTVVTAMDQNETDESVFTNIDGAVII